jgi:hypothetical protein
MGNQENINQILNAVKSGHASPEFAAMMIAHFQGDGNVSKPAPQKKSPRPVQEVSERAAAAMTQFGRAAKKTHDGVKDALPLSEKTKNAVGSALVIALFLLIIVGAVAVGFWILQGVGALFGGLLGASVATSVVRG